MKERREREVSFVDDPPLCISLQRFSASIMGGRSICGRLEFEKMAHGQCSELDDLFFPARSGTCWSCKAGGCFKCNILFTRHGRYNTHETSAHLVRRKEKNIAMIVSEIKL
ncbi:unnamed protein product [Cercospora beticola]|nr:unnamed protein product [Cercospora beticola]